MGVTSLAFSVIQIKTLPIYNTNNPKCTSSTPSSSQPPSSQPQSSKPAPQNPPSSSPTSKPSTPASSLSKPKSQTLRAVISSMRFPSPLASVSLSPLTPQPSFCISPQTNQPPANVNLANRKTYLDSLLISKQSVADSKTIVDYVSNPIAIDIPDTVTVLKSKKALLEEAGATQFTVLGLELLKYDHDSCE